MCQKVRAELILCGAQVPGVNAQQQSEQQQTFPKFSKVSLKKFDQTQLSVSKDEACSGSGSMNTKNMSCSPGRGALMRCIGAPVNSQTPGCPPFTKVTMTKNPFHDQGIRSFARPHIFLPNPAKGAKVSACDLSCTLTSSTSANLWTWTLPPPGNAACGQPFL